MSNQGARKGNWAVQAIGSSVTVWCAVYSRVWGNIVDCLDVHHPSSPFVKPESRPFCCFELEPPFEQQQGLLQKRDITAFIRMFGCRVATSRESENGTVRLLCATSLRCVPITLFVALFPRRSRCLTNASLLLREVVHASQTRRRTIAELWSPSLRAYLLSQLGAHTTQRRWQPEGSEQLHFAFPFPFLVR